jgi:hypothetical protein
MNQSPSPSEQNLETERKHRRDFAWQIVLPLSIGAVVMLATIILVGLSDAGYVGRWADISLIWVLICPMTGAWIIAAILGGIAYGMWKLLQWLPPFAFKIQRIFEIVRVKSQQILDGLVSPVLQVHQWSASAKAFRQKTSEQLQKPLENSSRPK